MCLRQPGPPFVPPLSRWLFLTTHAGNIQKHPSSSLQISFFSNPEDAEVLLAWH